MNDLFNADYTTLLTDVKDRIRSAQYAAMRVVNRELMALYWDIGRMIVQRQQGESWGRAIIENLAQYLQGEFPGIKGFSVANLWRMKGIYENYSENKKLAHLVRKIAWGHNIVIMERCKDPLQREFYIRMTRRMGWSRTLRPVM